jgi:hypothetical protein
VKVGLLLAVLAASVCAAFAGVGSAAAATSCRDKVFNDWYADGKISSRYPISCYRAALRHIPADASVYSTLESDIKAALQAALRRSQGKSVPSEIGHGLRPLEGRTPAASHLTSDPARDAAAKASGPTASAQSGGAPLPVLVLGGVALALIAAGAVGAGVRHVRRRP